MKYLNNDELKGIIKFITLLVSRIFQAALCMTQKFKQTMLLVDVIQ